MSKRTNRKSINKKYVYLLVLLFALTIGGYLLFSPSYALTGFEDNFETEIVGNDVVITKYKGSASEVTIPATVVIGGTTYNTVINNIDNNNTSLFAGNTTITKVTIENGVKAGESLRYMFKDCSNLKTVIFNNFDTSMVTNMQQMFMGCSSLEKLDLSGFNTTNVTTMQAMFYGCGALKELNISSLDTTNVTNLHNMFAGFANTNSLSKIVLGSKMNFKINDPKGYPFGRGTWKRAEDGRLYAAADIVVRSQTQNISGTYTKVSGIIDEMNINYPVNYRIDYLKDVEVDFTTTNSNNIKFVRDGTKRYVYLDNLAVQSNDDYSIPGTTTLLMRDAVVDNAGNRYNLKMTLDNIHIYNFTTDENGGSSPYEMLVTIGNHISVYSQFYKNLDDLKAAVNTIYTNSPLKVDITLQIVDEGGSEVDGGYIFSAYDLDIPSIKDASGYPSGTDGKGYGNYSEGINLLSGYDTTYNTLKMYSNTKLIKNGNRIFGTHVDEATELSEFSIKVDANNFKFTWTGEKCGTSILYRYQPRTVEISKKDEAGNFVSGAVLALYQGNELYTSWTTTSESKKLFLAPGAYMVRETTTPEGYTSAVAVTFYADIDDTLTINGQGVSEVTLVDTRKTYSYIVNYYDKETNEVIHDRKTVTNVPFGTEITSLNEVINITNYRYENANVSTLTIGTGENIINLYYVRIKGGVVEKHVDEYSNEILYEKSHSLPVGDDYDIPSKTFPGYRLVETRLPSNARGTVTEEPQEVVYYYHKVFHVTTRVEGTGGTIVGDEDVLEGDNSTEGKIVITPDENHYISKVTVNGEEIDILDEKGFVVPNFLNMHEDKEVVVTFDEIIKNVPKTSRNTVLPIIAGVFVFILLMLAVTFKSKKKILPME